MWRHPRFPQAGVAPSATRLPQQRCARTSASAAHARARRGCCGPPLRPCAGETERPPTTSGRSRTAVRRSVRRSVLALVQQSGRRLARSFWLARLRQPAPAFHWACGTHPPVRSAKPPAGGGGTEHPPRRPGVARHQSRFRRDRGCVTSFSISAHSAGPTQSQTTARRTSSSPRECRRRYFCGS